MGQPIDDHRRKEMFNLKTYSAHFIKIFIWHHIFVKDYSDNKKENPLPLFSCANLSNCLQGIFYMHQPSCGALAGIRNCSVDPPGRINPSTLHYTTKPHPAFTETQNSLQLVWLNTFSLTKQHWRRNLFNYLIKTLWRTDHSASVTMLIGTPVYTAYKHTEFIWDLLVTQKYITLWRTDHTDWKSSLHSL